MREITVLCASGSLGLTPFHEESFHAGVARKPDVIAADAGSGDIGPFYLGSGAPYSPWEWEKHDLGLMLEAALALGVPTVVGSCGGAGTNAGVDRYADILREIARERRLGPFTVALIYSEVDLEYLRRRTASEVIPGLGAPDPLTPEDVDASSRVVAMMGVEPIIEALNRGAQVVLAGRACDDGDFAAVPIKEGLSRALSLHMGKSIECGPLVATPILAREAVMGTVRENDFLVEPLHPGQRCTPASVAGHSLYERADPRYQPGPGGTLDLTRARFEAYTDRIVSVSGSAYIPDPVYKVKLEGAGWVGHRALFIFGLRDPISIRNVDRIQEAIMEEVRTIYPEAQPGRDYDVYFHVYGKNAIMGDREPVKRTKAHELGIVTEVIAQDRGLAEGIAKLVKYMALRAHYPGKVGTAGGAAFIADEVLKPEHDAYRWTVDHLLPVSDPLELFPMKLVEIGG